MGLNTDYRPLPTGHTVFMFVLGREENHVAPGGRSENWLQCGLEFPVVEHVKGILDRSD